MGAKSIAAAIVLAVSATAAVAQSHLPDDGIRRRLDGCWGLNQQAVHLCFDGVNRTLLEFDGGDVPRHGTYTVRMGRVLLDLSPDHNPANETYPSCAVSIGSDRDPAAFSLGRCANWTKLELPRTLEAATATRTTNTWLAHDVYEGAATSRFDAPLSGCWKKERSPEWAEFLRDNPMYLSSYELCFEGETEGSTKSVTFDASDGWGDSGTFDIIDGRLVLRSGYDDADDLRCGVIVEPDSLEMFDCAHWHTEDGRSLPYAAADPTAFTRLEENDDS